MVHLLLFWCGLTMAADGPANRLSRRTQLRYEDVITTRDGTRWHGEVQEEGDVYRIRLSDGSVVAIPKAEVLSVSRELDAGYPHSGQWGFRVTPGAEVGVAVGQEDVGLRYGGSLQLSVSRSLGGFIEPEIVAILTPINGSENAYAVEVAVGSRVYFQVDRRGKPFTYTHFVVAGTSQDLGLRTGPGFQLDFSPNFGIGFSQGIALISQLETNAFTIGYALQLELQTRF